MRSCFQQLSLEHPFGPGPPLRETSCFFSEGKHRLLYFICGLLLICPCARLFSLVFVPSFSAARRCAYIAFANLWVYTNVTNVGF